MSEREELENILAIFFAHNRQPHMSGDPRARLSPLQRRDMEDAITEILAAGWSRALPAPKDGELLPCPFCGGRAETRSLPAPVVTIDEAAFGRARDAWEGVVEWSDEGQPGQPFIANFDEAMRAALTAAFKPEKREAPWSMRAYTVVEKTDDPIGGLWSSAPFSMRHVVWVEEQEANEKLAAALAALDEAREALGELREYAESVWFDEASASDEEHDLMFKARAALARIDAGRTP